jgi:lysophospholipase L1-like esterase
VETNKNYFFQTFLVLLISAGAFIAFKAVLPKKLMEQSKLESKNVVIDSLLLDAIEEDINAKNNELVDEKDSLIKKVITFKANPKSGVKYASEKFDNYKGYQHVIPFYEKLQQLEATKTGSVRIAYFGDSMNDGDMIVQDIRKIFQDQFGGQGVGFVNIISESASSRATIKHEFSTNWKTQSYLKTKNPIRSFGVNGHVFFANDTLHSTWVKYKANNYKHLTQLNNPTLYYGNSTNKEAMISYVIGKDTIYKKLNGENQLNTLKLAENLKSVKVNFINAENVPIYGFNFDDDKGVHVDNFSNRGNSGLPISIFNVGMMHAFDSKLNYDLVVLHYGTNVLNYGTYDYSWYEKRMTKVVNHIKQCFPGVAVLIVSTADKSTKYDLEMKTDSAVVPLAIAQKKYAVKSEAGFVNLYTLMGGDGSMVQWVEGVPSKANKDYTHFNYTGSKEIAKLIYNEIFNGYSLFKTLNKGYIVPKRKKDSVYTKIDSTNE